MYSWLSQSSIFSTLGAHIAVLTVLKDGSTDLHMYDSSRNYEFYRLSYGRACKNDATTTYLFVCTHDSHIHSVSYNLDAFPCTDGSIILSQNACDGINHCVDKSDEVNCSHVCQNTNSTFDR